MRIRARSRRRWAALLLACWVVGLYGCSPRKWMVAQVGGFVQDGQPAYEQESNLFLLSYAFPSHIKMLEVLLAGDPRNPEMLLLLARLYGGYGFSILETEWTAAHYDQPSVLGIQLSTEALERQIAHCYHTGAEYALKALSLRHPNAVERLANAENAIAFIDELQKSDVPALYWYAFNLGRFIAFNLDSVQAISRAYLVENAMRRVVALDPAFENGGADLALMIYHAERPAMMGGSIELAKRHYEQNRLLAPQMGLRELFWARYYLVQTHQRDEFVKVMTALSTKSLENDPHALLDSVAAQRATVYLNAVDYFFND